MTLTRWDKCLFMRVRWFECERIPRSLHLRCTVLTTLGAPVKTFWIAMVTFVLSTSQAEARRTPMKSQNRVHIGGAWTPGGSMVGMGFDSRMTQAILIDVGAFLSPGDPGTVPEEDPYILRHGIYVDPGIRIPHRNKSDLMWDIILRGGFGPVWVADQLADYKAQITPSLNGGADLLFRYKEFGFRIEGRAWYSKPFSRYEQQEVVTVRPQVGASVLYTF